MKAHKHTKTALAVAAPKLLGVFIAFTISCFIYWQLLLLLLQLLSGAAITLRNATVWSKDDEAVWSDNVGRGDRAANISLPIE